MQTSRRSKEANAEVALPRTAPFHFGEWLILLTAAAALLVRCVQDRGRPLWCDEAYTAFAVADPSFAHMLEALRDEISAMPPLSVVLGWGIARIIGVSEFALRFPSALFSWVGIVLLWLCLRRSLNRWVATWCAVCLPLLSATILFNTTEARCYALYFAAYVAAVGLYLRCAEKGVMTPREPWLVTLAHGILVAVHYVGGILSALRVTVALTAGYLWPAHRQRYRRYALQGLLGWLAVIPSLPFYLAQRRLGTEFNWIPRPSLSGLYAQMVSGVGAFQVVVMPLLIWALVAEGRRGTPDAGGRRTPAMMRAIALLVVASQVFLTAVWVESRVGPNIVLDRYLFPLSLAWILAIAFVADLLVARLWQMGAGQGRDNPIGLTTWPSWFGCRTLVLATALTLTLFIGMKIMKPKVSPVTLEAEAIEAVRARHGVPIVTTSAHVHAVLGWYRRSSGRVVMLNDSNNHEHPIGVRIGNALNHHYIPNSMMSLTDCTREFDSFVYVTPDPLHTDVNYYPEAKKEWRSTPLSQHTAFWERHRDDPAP